MINKVQRVNEDNGVLIRKYLLTIMKCHIVVAVKRGHLTCVVVIFGGKSHFF